MVEGNPFKSLRGVLIVHIYLFTMDISLIIIIFIFFKLYVLLRVQHSCSSIQSWGSVLPSIVETRDQNSRGCPLLFSNRNLGSFCA